MNAGRGLALAGREGFPWLWLDVPLGSAHLIQPAPPPAGPSLEEQSLLAGHLGALTEHDEAVRGGDFGEVRE